MSEWKQIKTGLDSDTITFFEDEVSGDQITVKDNYQNNLISRFLRKDRYKVNYDRNSGLADHTLSDTFPHYREAIEYAVEGVIGDDLENYKTELTEDKK